MLDTSVVSIQEKRNLKPGSKIAKRFAELVTNEGRTPKEAANLLRIDLGDPGSYAIAAEVQQILKGYSMRPEIVREFVRASRNKILIEAMTGEYPDHGLALDAAKQIASDPDVGLNAPPAPLVSLSFNSIEDILKQFDDDVIDVVLEDDAEKES